MLKRYLRAQLTVLLFGGLAGPVLLAVYFGLGDMARPALNWMFWVGLIVTVFDVAAALALATRAVKSPARQDFPLPAAVLPPLTVSQRLLQLDTLHATGAITDAEYSARRQQILADL